MTAHTRPMIDEKERDLARVLIIRVHIPYFGNIRNGMQLAERVTKFLRLKFGENVSVQWKDGSSVVAD